MNQPGHDSKARNGDSRANSRRNEFDILESLVSTHVPEKYTACLEKIIEKQWARVMSSEGQSVHTGA